MVKGTFLVERSATILAVPHVVHEQIVDLRKWRAWSPWEDLDPKMRRVYSGARSGTGAVYDWTGNDKAGAGSMRILENVPPRHLKIALAFDHPYPARNTVWFTIAPAGEDSSHVIWTMTGSLSPGLRLFSLVRPMDRMIGPDLDRGLARLKTLLESPV